MGVTFEIDPITPRSAGGMSTLENLCVCYPTCNRHKAARTQALDPVTGQIAPLFHPILDTWQEHFEWREAATFIAGRTAAGRTTVAALQMNRPMMIELRRYWAATDRHPPPDRTG